MKKIFSLIILFTTLLTLSCSPKITESEVTQPNIHYSIFVGGGTLSTLIAQQEEAGVSVDTAALNVEVKDMPKDCEFYFPSTNTIDFKNSQAPQKIDYIIDGKEFSLEYKGSKTNPLASSSLESLNRLGSIDNYTTRLENNQLITFHMMTETQQIALYIDHSADEVDGDFTTKQAEEKANEIITELYGAECLQYYGDAYRVKDVTDDYKYIVVSYYKTIGKFKTSDCITLKFNLKGELSSINAYYYGILQSVIDQYSEEQLEAADVTLKNYLDQCSYGYSGYDGTLVINSKGDCYLQLTAVTAPNVLRDFYINIT